MHYFVYLGSIPFTVVFFVKCAEGSRIHLLFRKMKVSVGLLLISPETWAILKTFEYCLRLTQMVKRSPKDWSDKIRLTLRKDGSVRQILHFRCSKFFKVKLLRTQTRVKEWNKVVKVHTDLYPKLFRMRNRGNVKGYKIVASDRNQLLHILQYKIDWRILIDYFRSLTIPRENITAKVWNYAPVSQSSRGPPQ